MTPSQLIKRNTIHSEPHIDPIELESQKSTNILDLIDYFENDLYWIARPCNVLGTRLGT